MKPETEAKIKLLYRLHRQKSGEAGQILKLAEEAAELTKAAISFHYLMAGQYIGDKDPLELEKDLISEATDVIIMIEQARLIIDKPVLWRDMMSFKLKRALDRIEGAA